MPTARALAPSSGGGLCVALLLLSVGALAGCVSRSELSDFATDGCSAFPDGSPSQRDRWFGCCYVHDVRYWEGGTREARQRADSELQACVRETTGDKALADLMYQGVRLGGHPVFPTPYRWGYGWSYERSYAPLDEQEQAQVVRKKQALCALLEAGRAPDGRVEVAAKKTLEAKFVRQVCPAMTSDPQR
jgi:hypothetical protein